MDAWRGDGLPSMASNICSKYATFCCINARSLRNSPSLNSSGGLGDGLGCTRRLWRLDLHLMLPCLEREEDGGVLLEHSPQGHGEVAGVWDLRSREEGLTLGDRQRNATLAVGLMPSICVLLGSVGEL